MTAQEKFRQGQIVWASATNPFRLNPSPNARARNSWGGIVVGFCRKPELVKIKQFDRVSVHSWHMDFWEALFS